MKQRMKNVIGPAVRRIRKRCWLSVAELAARMARQGYALTIEEIMTVEEGRRRVKDVEVLHLARALCVCIEDLFSRRNRKRRVQPRTKNTV